MYIISYILFILISFQHVVVFRYFFVGERGSKIFKTLLIYIFNLYSKKNTIIKLLIFEIKIIECSLLSELSKRPL